MLFQFVKVFVQNTSWRFSPGVEDEMVQNSLGSPYRLWVRVANFSALPSCKHFTFFFPAWWKGSPHASKTKINR